MSDNADWPLVLPHDDGIRPAGPPDACFCCHAHIGEPHARDCVTITKRVKVRYTFDLEVDIPHFWTRGDFEWHHNFSSWCADNALRELRDYGESKGCLCGHFSARLLETTDNTPRQKEVD